jgi:hypothetical protein
MKTLVAAIVAALVVLSGVDARGISKPRLQVAPDGFPSGHSTPEGAASDLARAFIRRDSALFRSACVRLYGPAAYSEFLEKVIESMRQEAAKATPSPSGPKSIAKVFAARHLTQNGPASYGYATFGFQDVMFVDVGVVRHSGAPALNRTMVIKDKDGEWYVHPVPSVSPLLSAGLNEESGSEQDFSEVYDVAKDERPEP